MGAVYHTIIHMYNSCSFLEGWATNSSLNDHMSSSHPGWMARSEGGWICKRREGGGSFRTAEERRGRWEEGGGRGGPNMTCVSVF